MKTIDENEIWTPENPEMKDKELLEIAIETIRRYTTTLGTILVEHGGTYVFDPFHTAKIAGQTVDFEVALMEDGKVKLKLIVNGKEWSKEETEEESSEE